MWSELAAPMATAGKGAALAAVIEQGKVGAVKIVAMDRNPDMLPYIADGTIYGAVAQKSWLESYLAGAYARLAEPVEDQDRRRSGRCRDQSVAGHGLGPA